MKFAAFFCLFALLSFSSFAQKLSSVLTNGIKTYREWPLDSVDKVLKIYIENAGVLPKDIDKYRNLQSLQICGNDWDYELNSLPAAFYKLSKLRYFYISNTNLVELSPEIAKLSELNELYLAGNKIKSLPAQLSELKKLKILSIDHIDDEIPYLPNLESLAYGNDYYPCCLPLGIEKLKKLNNIDLYSDSKPLCMATIQQLKQLPLLEKLTLRCGTLKDSSFLQLSALSQLKELKLNGINGGSFIIGNFKHLKKLDIDLIDKSQMSAPATKFYSGLLTLDSLESFTTSYNAADLPFYRKIKNITLKLNSDVLIGSVIDSLSSIPGLISLYFPPFLEAMPANLVKLKHLKELDLSGQYYGNYKETIQILSQLPELQKVIISNDQFSEFPDEIKLLKGLKELAFYNFKHGIVPAVGEQEKAKLQRLLPDCHIIFYE
jgi:leucine-rich repeat protein SHOC2